MLGDCPERIALDEALARGPGNPTAAEQPRGEDGTFRIRDNITNSDSLPVEEQTTTTKVRHGGTEAAYNVRRLRRLAEQQRQEAGPDAPQTPAEALLEKVKGVGQTDTPGDARTQGTVTTRTLTATEMVEAGKALERLEREKARERMTAGVNQHTEPCGKLPQGSTGKTRDKVASSLGISGRTYEKAKQVVEAAQEQPDLFGDLP